MTATPAAAAALATGHRNRVLLVIVLVALAAAFGMAFVSVAPNRLVSGTGVPLLGLMSAGRHALWLPAVLLTVAAFLPSRGMHGVVAVTAALLLAGLTWLAGSEAMQQSSALSPLARVSLGGGFWVLALTAWLAASDAVQRLGLPPAWRTLTLAGVLLPLPMLLASDHLDALSLFKEYMNRRDVFNAAGQRHLQIVLSALLPALVVGVPLGVAAARSKSFAGPLLATLNIIQTVPSIALFALLIAPLGALAALLPGWGLQGIGLLPAAIALTLYALLPIVHGTAAGLAQVPAAAIEAAAGMGMTRRQTFWRVRVPLALPVLLSGLRVTTVQVIGLAVVAALIGAGGFGALVFQGLASSALDLVLLGVLPVVALAMAADAALALLAAAVVSPQGPGTPGPAPPGGARKLGAARRFLERRPR
jgi:osmoprotectant transport system permease protein